MPYNVGMTGFFLSQRIPALLVASLAATACSPQAAATLSAPPPAPDAGTGAPSGAALYQRYCAVCHGADGRTVDGIPAAPNLNSQGLLAVADDAFLRASIVLGRPGMAALGRPGTKMPAFGVDEARILAADEIDAIIAYLRTWQTEPNLALDPYAAVGDPRSGATTYAEGCASCHGPDGWGVDAPRLAGDVFQASASDAFIWYAIRHGRPGTRMQAHDYDDPTMSDLVAFIRTLGSGEATGTP